MLYISTLEVDFSSKQIYLGVVEQFITDNNHCKDVHVTCANCRVVMKVIVRKCSVAFQAHYSIIIASTNVRTLSLLRCLEKFG